MKKTFADVTLPQGLNERQIGVAQDYVVSRLQDGFTINNFVSKHGLSTKTFYAWKEIEGFSSYIDELNEVLIPSDVLSAVEKFRKRVMEFVEKETMTKEEMNQFHSMFKHVIDASNRMEAEKLGLNISAGSPTSVPTKSVEERKASLLSRLKGNTTTTSKGEI
ncbi:hypothetical protein [Bacillus sp. CHD6a]|uniref:hypothetical protein n=1 Tax=Bacillus sp. CHD6a TaxID=1643452 RepID=UPI0006CE00F3|nr:hypothetical protein [Bacillus sp. CHD6a]KPB06326.1 hypothetical protein AAV98_00530 [Bacillus sp. CHD6a]